jgi:site-specific recombinase XerD
LLLNIAKEFRGKIELDRYLAKLQADRFSPTTIVKNRDYLKICLTYIDKDPLEISLDDIERWKYEMAVNKKYQPETMWASIIMLRKFLRDLGKTEMCDKIKLPRRPARPPPEKEIWLLPEEQRRMLDKSREMNKRAYAMISLFMSSGVRRGELRDIDLPDIDMEHQTIQIRHGKGDRSRIVCFDTETRNALTEYIKERRETTDGSQALFVSHYSERLSGERIAEIIKECRYLAGITKNITPHKLRHTFITNVIERTKDIPLAMKLAGHTELKTTMRYHHSTHEEMVDKYRKFLDEPSGPLLLTQRCSIPKEEILRGLDAKYIKGELPVEVYQKIRAEYQKDTKNTQKQSNIEDRVAGYG